MKSILATAMVAATLVGSTLAAKADTTFSFPPNNGLFNEGKGVFTQIAATFTAGVDEVLSGISASASTKGLTFKSDSLYLGSTGTGAALFTDAQSGPSFADFPGYALTAGQTYSIVITGNGPGKFNGNYTLSSVPLPTSVALFGGAIAALGVAGAVRRKMSATA